MKEDKKKVFIRTFGCQMNVRDAEVVSGLLKNEGYKIVDGPEKADILILNTCSVRQHAEDKVWSEIGRFSKSRGQSSLGTAPIIGVIGCMAQNYKDAVFQRSAEVDFVVGPQDIAKIPGIVNKLVEKGQFHKGKDSSLLEMKIWETEGEARPDEVYRSGFYADKKHAYVVISEGCSNFCSYCVVPFVRGALKHRLPRDILKEIKAALESGISNITLLGQNVNVYQSEGANFIRLLELINALKGLKEFSFITSHPKDTSVDLFRAMAGLEKLKKYLHLPVQSGSDRVLKLMNRGYDAKFYLDLIENYRKIVKGAVLTTDVIVGFPGETEADFKASYDLVKKAEFNAAFIFKYSPRPHTAASNLADSVSREEKEKRHGSILSLQKNISLKNVKKKS